MFNQTIHIILYASDLRAVARLQEIETGNEVIVKVIEYEDKRHLCADCKQEIQGTTHRYTSEGVDRCEACATARKNKQ